MRARDARKPPARHRTKPVGRRVIESDPQGRQRRWRPILLLPALFVATLVAYQPVWRGGLLWDDGDHITKSALQSLKGLWQIWFHIGATQQYYPVVHSMFWLMHQLWGGDTLGYHLVNIALHSASAYLVFVILRRLSVPGAVLAACIFALHPVEVESVAWITELKNTLSGVFYLGAFVAYLEFDRDRRARHYSAALALFVLALLSKSVTATLPVALLVVFWWQRGRVSWRRDVVPVVPFLALGLVAGLTTAWVERTFIGASGSEFQFTIIERGLIASHAILFYLAKLVWPTHLIFFYERWHIDQHVWQQYLYPLGVIALFAALWRYRTRSRAPLAALLFFVATLAPALGFVNVFPFRFSFVADHFQYLAGLGIIAGLAAGLTTLARRWTKPAADAALICVIVMPLAMITWRQSHQYADAETLYRETIARNPSAWLAHLNLAVLELDGPPGDLDDAVAHLHEALRLEPDEPLVHNNLGVALQREGRYADAIAEHREALRLKPDDPLIHNDLGVALQRMGRFADAMTEHREALRLDPGYAEAQSNLGIDLQGLGRLAEAATAFRTAVTLSPSSAAAHQNLGMLLLQLGRRDDAMTQMRDALALNPDSPDIHMNLGTLLQEFGRLDEAAEQCRDALRLRPDYAEAHNNLGVVLEKLGRFKDAAVEFRATVRLLPRSARAHGNLADVLRASGDLGEAIAEYKQAIGDDVGAGSADFHNSLGVALAGLGRHDEAMREFQEALRLRPDFPEARANLTRTSFPGPGRGGEQTTSG